MQPDTKFKGLFFHCYLLGKTASHGTISMKKISLKSCCFEACITVGMYDSSGWFVLL